MFDIITTPLEDHACRAAPTDDRAGAMVTFEGRVRNHHDGREVTGLEYEVYIDLARSEGQRILREAAERFDLIDGWCLHRAGRLGVGETAVWVCVLATHRRAALDGCAYIIEELKGRLPIWKKEYYSEGDSAWVNLQQPATPSEGEHRP